MQTSIRAAVIAFAGALILSGCGGFLRHGGTSNDYQLTTNRTSYARGNTGEVTVRNVSDRNVEYNLCQRRLERQANKYWVVAFEWPVAGGACTTIARTLKKSESVTTLFDIPTGVPAGSYRLVFTGLLDADGKIVSPDEAATGSFTVR
jgi:hypothetical protein